MVVICKAIQDLRLERTAGVKRLETTAVGLFDRVLQN